MASLLVFDLNTPRMGDLPDTPESDRIGGAESLGAAIRRICVGRLDTAIAELAAGDGDRDRGVHTARKSLKRVRALIRLVRDTVGFRAYREVNVVVRDAARRMAPVRDGAVMVDVVDRIVDRYRLDPAWVAATRSGLSATHVAARRVVLEDPATMIDTLTALRVVRRLLAAWPVDDPAGPLAVPDDFSAISGGLRRVYRRGRLGYERSGTEMTEEAFHEWRKRVKYLRHQMEALHDARPEVVGAAAVTLAELGETLGEEHDFAVFRSVLEDGSLPDFPERRMLAALAFAEQDRHRREALRVGAPMYAERPSEFVARIGSYWEVWRAGGNDRPQGDPLLRR